MSINIPDDVKSKEDFIIFIKNNIISEKNNDELNDYFESVVSWVEDMDGYYKNMGLSQPEVLNWNFIATLFYVGTIYE